MQGLLAAFMNPPADDEAGFNAWYDEEHIGMLLEVPGWRRVRLFQHVEGEGAGIHGRARARDTGVFEHPNYEKSIATPWRQRIRSSVSRYERNLFKALR